MKYFVLVLSLIIVLPVFGQRKKKDDELAIIPTYREGIVYALPRTGIRIHVNAVEEKVIAGPFSGYADQLLGITNVAKSNSSKWHIIDVKIESFSEPDPDKVFKAMGNGAFLLNLTPDGCLAGINSETAGAEARPIKTNRVMNKPQAKEDFSFDYLTDTPFYVEGDSTNGYRPIRVSSEKKAVEAAERVLESRLYQYDLASGMLDEMHPDGDAYKFSMAQLKQMEKDYTSLFVGRITYKEASFSFDFVPTSNSGKGQVVFRISDEKGVVPASDLSGKPVMIEFETNGGLTKKYEGLKTSENPAAGQSGVFYRMPGLATIKVIYELNTIATARATIAQFGEITPLPEEMLDGSYSIDFHANTGAIKSVRMK